MRSVGPEKTVVHTGFGVWYRRRGALSELSALVPLGVFRTSRLGGIKTDQ